jgi:hypothetical protein
MTMAYHMDDVSLIYEDHTYRSYLKRLASDLVREWIDELSRK